MRQAAIDYAMPWRIMRYDQMEYGRQIREIISRRRAASGMQGRPAGNWTKRLQQNKLNISIQAAQEYLCMFGKWQCRGLK